MHEWQNTVVSTIVKWCFSCSLFIKALEELCQHRFTMTIDDTSSDDTTGDVLCLLESFNNDIFGFVSFTEARIWSSGSESCFLNTVFGKFLKLLV